MVFKSRALDEREEKFKHHGVLHGNSVEIRQGTIYFSFALKEDTTKGTHSILLGRARDSVVDWLRAGRSGLLTPVETKDFFLCSIRTQPLPGPSQSPLRWVPNIATNLIMGRALYLPSLCTCTARYMTAANRSLAPTWLSSQCVHLSTAP